MIRKGKVSTVDNINRKARVIITELNNSISPELAIAHYVGELNINDVVVINFYENLQDGLIIENENSTVSGPIDLSNLTIDGGSFV